MKREELPARGVVVWPVGNGDSITVLVADDDRAGHEVVMQVDLHHMSQAEDESDPHVAVIDALEEILPDVGGKPYLSVFVLTHPDQDHIRGFADLLDRVVIGELWFTPRIFREQDELCEDAQVFRDEAHRRLRAVIDAGARSVLEVDPGDRIRVVGYDELFEEDDYKDLPAQMRSIPGSQVSSLDGYDYMPTVEVFLHSPFKDDSQGERNDCSLGFQLTLTEEDCTHRFLLLGDLAHETIAKIFDVTDDADKVAWDVLLAPHHCSKHALYDADGNLDSAAFEGLKESASESAWVVSSSRAFSATDEEGDLPPHVLARERYEEIVGADHFVATATHGDEDSPDPIVFAVGDDCGYRKPVARAAAATGLTAAVRAANGSSRGPTTRGRYGQ